MNKTHKENMRKVVDETVKILMFVHLNRDENCQAGLGTAQNTQGKACRGVRKKTIKQVFQILFLYHKVGEWPNKFRQIRILCKWH